MLNIGKHQLLTAEKETEFGFYLSDGRNHRETVLLPKKFAGGIQRGRRTRSVPVARLRGPAGRHDAEAER